MDGRLLKVTIVATDLRNFTAMSEKIPEGDVYEHLEWILTRATCGHYTFRSLASVPPEEMEPFLAQMDRAWAFTPCPRCEPGSLSRGAARHGSAASARYRVGWFSFTVNR